MARAVASGRVPARAQRRPLGGRIARGILPIYTGLAVLYLLLPIAVMILFGFNDIQGRFNFTWQGFTLRHWLDAFRFPAMVDALRISLIVAAV
jgi:spermidine/putrescine transport system permease protein